MGFQKDIYKIQRQGDGSFVILRKDPKGKLTIDSHHDTYEQAKDELDDLNNPMSQADAIKFIKDLRNSMPLKDIIT